MNTRFYNARILDKDFQIIQGELHVVGNRIAYIGPEKTQDAYGENAWDREIDAKGNLLIPGFKDAHTHSAMTFLRSYADDLPLLDWLNKQVFPMEAKLVPEDVYHLSKLAILEYLTSGITSNFDMYFYPEQIAKASVDCGFRTVLVSPMNDFSSSPKEMEEDYIKFNEYDPLIRYCLGFHAEYTTSEERLKEVARLAQKYQAPVFTHNSETEAEVCQCIERNGTTPTQYLDSLGVWEYGGGGYHCVYMTQEDLDIFKKRKLYAVTNPGSNTKLASGIAPVQKMLDQGISVAIGTDGPASNNCLDMFREMFLVTGLAKLREKDASAVGADQVLKMAVSEGARCCGLNDCDCLAEGKLADLVMIDLHRPNMQPENNLVKNLVYSGSKENVKLTMVNGSILYEDGLFSVGEDPEEISLYTQEILNTHKKEAELILCSTESAALAASDGVQLRHRLVGRDILIIGNGTHEDTCTAIINKLMSGSTFVDFYEQAKLIAVAAKDMIEGNQQKKTIADVIFKVTEENAQEVLDQLWKTRGDKEQDGSAAKDSTSSEEEAADPDGDNADSDEAGTSSAATTRR